MSFLKIFNFFQLTLIDYVLYSQFQFVENLNPIKYKKLYQLCIQYQGLCKII
jgi:hypothetical protein